MATTSKKNIRKTAVKTNVKNLPSQVKGKQASGVNLKCKNCSGYEEKILAESGEMLNEIGLMAKHEIIAKMACILGDKPEHLSISENIFDELRYQITEYVVKHEFNRENKLSVQMTLWLDDKKEPSAGSHLSGFIQKYLSPIRQ